MENETNLFSQISQDENIDLNKYIIFSLDTEIYGTPLLDVREVVEQIPAKTIPNTAPFFEGVCNLRGQIIGIIDLQKRFGINGNKSACPIMFVFDTESGAIAATVDKILSVSLIPPADIERSPNIVSNIPQKLITGIAKLQTRLITLIDLKAILSNEELVFLDNSKMKLKVS